MQSDLIFMYIIYKQPKNFFLSYPCMIVDAADFSNGEFEEDIDGAAASCREHKILIVMFVFIKTTTTITH